MKLELQRTEIPFQEIVASSCFWLVYKFQEHINQQDRTESHRKYSIQGVSGNAPLEELSDE